MQAVVSCPECRRKLKVAEASLGKKVKCPSGHVFVARKDLAENAPEASPSLLIVTCDGCQTQLKVPATARGRRMKCSKCATIFVVGGPPTPTPEPLPPRSRPTPPPALDSLDVVEEEEAPRPRRTARQPGTRTSEADWVEAASQPERPKHKPVAAPPPRRSWPLNLFVLLIMLAYGGAVAATYLGELDFLFPEPQQPPRPQVVFPPPEQQLQPPAEVDDEPMVPDEDGMEM